jgi:serine kinase of HPr protein (carbohydrate metabolism regulator)
MITLKEIAELLGANVVCGADRLDKTIKLAFASDLMSDVLTIDTSQLLLITGLTNLQTIRTAEMSDIGAIVFVRNKKVAPEMLELAEQNGLVVLESNMSMYRACGVLYNAGIKPVY